MKQARWTGEQFAITGYLSGLPAGTPSMEAAFALTHNVPRQLWERWYADNKDSDLVLNNLIFAHASSDHVTGHSREYERQRNGLEPLDPPPHNDPYRAPPPVSDPRIRSLMRSRFVQVGSATTDE